MYANRGMLLEELINFSNTQYLKKNIAVINKVPSKWIPIRNNKGKIISAKIEEKSIVDYLGRYKDIPIAFDAKSVQKESRWYLRYLEKHQFLFLKSWQTEIARSFVLLGFWLTEEFFFLPFDFIEEKYLQWLKGGEASLKLEDLKEKFPTINITNHIPLDYLSSVEKIITMEEEEKCLVPHT